MRRSLARRHSRRRRSVAPLAATLLLVLAACGGGEGDESSAPASVSARTAVVTRQSFSETIGAIGTVAARAGHVAVLSAPAQARVTRVDVTVGELVSPGMPLVEFDRTTFASGAEAADAALASAERAYERTSRLVNEGIAPRKDLEQASADLAQARAAAASARMQARLAVLRSPIGGVVTQVAATLGAMVDPSQPLVQVADPSAVDILLSVTPSDAARVRRGAKVTLSAGQKATGEPLGIATVVDVAGTVDTASRAVTVRAQAPTTRRRLRIGETVFGQIAVATVPNAVVVPNEALVPSGEGFRVFVVDANGIAHERAVEIGGRTESATEIRTGLTAGERVVTYGAYGMADSARVVPMESRAP